MSTTGHEHELVEVQGLKASMKKGGNIGIYNDVVCSTAGATAAKVTNTVPPSFTLTNKAKILVKFTYGINVANATLQVGENAAKPIYYQGSALDAGRVKAGMFVLMQYDGTNFNILGDIAKMDEYYKDLHAGLADNLFGETQTNDKFIFRPTAGIQDIESGEPPVGGGAIRKVEGNAVAWNQKVQNCDFSDGTNGWNVENDAGQISVSNNILTYTVTQLGKYKYFYRSSLGLTNGHIFYTVGYFLCSKSVSASVAADGQTSDTFTTVNSNFWTKASSIVSKSLGLDKIYVFVDFNDSLSVGDTVQVSSVNVIDLTLLFGSGNEPSTVEAFESWLSQNIGLKDYYPYNAGELIPVKDYKVKSVGFNAWDASQRVSGRYIQYTNGEEVVEGNYDHTGWVSVIGGANYYFEGVSIGQYGAFYDSDKQYISGINNFIGLFTTPINAHYVRISFPKVTLDNDICINLSYDDDKDGTYEQHWEHETSIDVTKIYGKLNGSGEYVQVFPDGMKRTSPSYFDVLDLKNAVATVKVKSVDLSTQSFGEELTNKVYFCSGFAETHGLAAQEGFASRYIRDYRARAGNSTNMSCVIDSNTSLYVHDESYTSLSDFTNSLQGVVFYGRLATPLTYTNLVFRENGVDIPVSEIKYAVDDYGTEEVLLGNDEDVVSVAPTMTIKYGINAADTVSSLPHTYVSSKYQSLNDVEQRTARANIAAASQHDMDVVKKQLELIDKKVENDYYVDMGLPSGVLWAKRNIFTGTGNDMGFAPSEYSYDASYFSWGNKEAHNPNGTTFDYDFGTSNSGPYASTDGAKLTGNIPLSQDAARENCGEPWRMPTAEEFKELFDNCDFIDASGNVIPSTQANKYTTMSSCVGLRLKSKINGGILFIPACGRGYDTSLQVKGSDGDYWEGNINSMEDGALLYFYSESANPKSGGPRFIGCTIRPVM